MTHTHEVCHVVWFKRDLRVHDNAPLHAAIEATRQHNQNLLLLYVWEPALWQQPDSSLRHAEAIAEGLHELREKLQTLGQTLQVVTGEMPAILTALHESYGSLTLYSHMETGNGWSFARDKAVQRWCKTTGTLWHEFAPFGVGRGSKRIAARPDWVKHWEIAMRRPLLPAPTQWPAAAAFPASLQHATDEILVPILHTTPCPQRQTVGRRAGVATLTSFLNERSQRYHRELSSPRTAAQSFSRLSTHLAYGTLSMAEVVQATRAQLKKPIEAEHARALRAFLSRLHWHCHFIQKLEDEPRMEHHALHPALDAVRPIHMDAETMARFNAWAEGRTGWPLVDACMAELVATGWITFRMRAMLVSTATVHLWLPWQPVALHLARLFTDYEPGIHYPQVQMQSGTTGMNTVRAYNPTKQAADQDPEGAYIRHWLPALRDMPQAYIHAPWQMPLAMQQQVKCIIGTDYPAPLVDEHIARKEGVAKLYGPRKTDDFRATRTQLIRKHGRRAMAPRRPPQPKAAEPPLLALLQPKSDKNSA
jgi:deoxyribodipyrimidine photo-lyase